MHSRSANRRGSPKPALTSKEQAQSQHTSIARQDSHASHMWPRSLTILCLTLLGSISTPTLAEDEMVQTTATVDETSSSAKSDDVDAQSLQPSGTPASTEGTSPTGKPEAVLESQGAPASTTETAKQSQKPVKIEIEGASSEQRSNILAYLSVNGMRDTKPERVRRLFQLAENEAKSALKALGHYHAKITSTLTEQNDSWKVKLTVAPGPAVIVDKINIHITGPGKDTPALSEARQDLPLHTGDVLNHGKYESIKQVLRRAALQSGYLDFQFQEKRLQVNIERNLAQVELKASTGSQFKFGTLTFEQDAYSPEFLQRYLTIKPGDAFSPDALQELRRSLWRSGYFSQVKIRPLYDQAEKESVPVVVHLMPVKRYHYSAQAGFGTDTGPRAGLAWENQRFGQNGKRFGFSTTGSEIKSAANAYFEMPWRQAETLRLYAKFEDETINEGFSRAWELGSRITHSQGLWTTTRFLYYRQEDFEAGIDRHTTGLLIGGKSWIYLKKDDPILPFHGLRFEITGQGAVENLLSELSLAQGMVNTTLIRPLGGRWRVILRANGGATLVSNFNELPTSLRFFAGGDQSVRGYGYQELAPKDESGEIAGGKYLLTGSGEVDFPVVADWRGAFFYDAGNAFDSFDGGLKGAVGIGARWLSPIGPFKIDLATPMDQGGIRLHLRIGPEI